MTKIVLLFLLFSSLGLAQETISGVVTDTNEVPLEKVAIYNAVSYTHLTLPTTSRV